MILLFIMILLNNYYSFILTTKKIANLPIKFLCIWDVFPQRITKYIQFYGSYSPIDVINQNSPQRKELIGTHDQSGAETILQIITLLKKTKIIFPFVMMTS